MAERGGNSMNRPVFFVPDHPEEGWTKGRKLLHESDWHVDTLHHSQHQFGVDLCPKCKEVAIEKKKDVEVVAKKVMDEAVRKAKVVMRELHEQAREAARQQRVGRLERDVVMRQRERQKISEG